MMNIKLPWAAVSSRVPEKKKDVEIVARRKTSDEKTFLLWSDGSITKPLGYYFDGTRKLPLSAGFVVADEIVLFDEAEVPLVLKAAKQLLKKSKRLLPGELRSLADRMIRDAARPAFVKPVWEVYRADRDGKPTERVWRVPKLLGLGGLAVWDYCGGRDSSQGRYHLMTCDREDVCEDTGFRFATLKELMAHLEKEKRAQR